MATNRILLWVGFSLVCAAATGQSLYVNSPVSLGKGGTGVAVSDEWSAVLNPAGTSKHQRANVSVGYHLPYFVNELSSKSALGGLPFKYGVLSAYVNQYGYSLYQENKAGISYARTLAPNLHAAFQINFLNTHLSQSGNGSQLFAGVGILYDALDDLTMGLYLSNPEKSEISILDETSKIPSLFVLGFNWNASANFDVSCEFEKQDGFDALYKLGLSYSINEKVWVRAGTFGKPVNYTMGLGFKVYDFKLDAGMTHHNILGISSCFGITYLFKKK